MYDTTHTWGLYWVSNNHSLFLIWYSLSSIVLVHVFNEYFGYALLYAVCPHGFQIVFELAAYQ